MPTISLETSSKSKRSLAPTEVAIAKSAQSRKPTSRTSSGVHPKYAPNSSGVTKHERLLTLLGQPNGASIEELMRATNWQQHSVRAFLAGTVKKKLGLDLTSSKSDGDVRRYRIVTRRGR
ncbi:MAG: DUF3489 domain-containing protein [Hyphomicrobium sp.]|nr:DUF3489 domain-containing protein [Hyphomicrobium sp.]